METSIYTQLEISGKTEEIMKAISVIMNHQYKTGRAKYYFADGTITVNNSRMKLQAELISEYLKNTEGQIQCAIKIELDGPYSLLEQLSPMYSSITPSGKKMRSLDWEDADNLYTCMLDNIGNEYEKCARHLMRSTFINKCDQSNVVESVPFTKDHMIILLTPGYTIFSQSIQGVLTRQRELMHGSLTGGI